MFGSTRGEAATLWAGVNATASLVGRRLTWVVAHEGERNRWCRSMDLPERVRPDDVASMCPSVYGITLVTVNGQIHVYDGQRNVWDARGSALADGDA